MKRGDLVMLKFNARSPVTLWDNPYMNNDLGSYSARSLYPDEVVIVLDITENPIQGFHAYQKLVYVHSNRSGFGWINSVYFEVIS